MPDHDDLLDPSEIEALLKSAGAFGDPPGTKPPSARVPAKDSAPAPDLESLLSQVPDERPAAAGPEELLNRAQQGVAAALETAAASPGPTAQRPRPKAPPDPRLSSARPYALESLESVAAATSPGSLKTLEEVELDLRIELGRAELLIEDVLKLREGAVVPLDKLAGDPVDILVNGRLVARGEVLVLNDNFCVRVAEILAPTLT